MLSATKLILPHGELPLPSYMPDATRGVVRSVDSFDLERVGLDALVMNTFHLMQKPGSTTIKALGGLHKMSGWSRPIVTDSGGFQIYSLIRQNSMQGSLTNKAAIFKVGNRKFQLTPEKTIQLQMAYGADILFCLDDCTHPADAVETQVQSVERTIKWARRCKDEFMRLLDSRGHQTVSPQLFAVVQGGTSRELRQRCAEALLEIGFDGFGYGGWPIDKDGNLLVDTFAYLRELIPPQLPLHALGVGHPPNIMASYKIGYVLFDSAMPTRDARHGRLYCFNQEDLDGDWFSYLYIQDQKHAKSNEPLCRYVSCWVDERYSRGYLHHLFAIRDTLAQRLATIHNLSFMTQLMRKLQNARPPG